MPVLFALVSLIGLLPIRSPQAAPASRPEDAWARSLSRYEEIAREAQKAPLPESRRREALDILSGFRVLVSSPVYETPPSIQSGPFLEQPHERLARAVMLLLQDMADIRRRLAEDPVSEEQSARIKRQFMRDRRDVGLFLDRMAELPKPPPQAQACEGKGKSKRGRKACRSAPELKDEPLPDVFPGTKGGLLSCRKVFRMQGHFQAEFPCWPWRFLSRERSESLLDPFSTAGTRPRGLWINDAEPMRLRTGAYRFKWKDGSRKHSQPFSLAEEVIRRPDMSGLAAREDASQVIIHPELRGTNFQIRGFYLARSTESPCEKSSDGYWSVDLSAVHWPTDASCRSWLSRWKPPLPGRATSALKPVEEPAPQGSASVFKKPYEMTYDLNLQHCGRPGRSIPKRVRVLCAKGPRGLYTFTLDATEEVFEDLLPALDRVQESFRLSYDASPEPLGAP
ncbi:MAG: hypothetical protein WCI75_16220 [candidate division NC10 bacterium]